MIIDKALELADKQSLTAPRPLPTRLTSVRINPILIWISVTAVWRVFSRSIPTSPVTLSSSSRTLLTARRSPISRRRLPVRLRVRRQARRLSFPFRRTFVGICVRTSLRIRRQVLRLSARARSALTWFGAGTTTFLPRAIRSKGAPP